MSFPDIMVKVKRYKNINVEYENEIGESIHWKILLSSESEFIQHEIDHLDGILAVVRAIDNKSIIYKTEYYKNKELYKI